MAEEDTYRKPYGQWLYLEDSPGWECLDIEPGEVVEFTTQHVPGHLGSGAIGAYLVRECSRAPDGSMVLKGRCVGCDNEEVGKTLSTLLNRHYLPLHLCWQEPCTLEGGSEVVHVVRARCFQREAFEAPYLKAWGKLVLRGMDGDKKDDGGAAGDGAQEEVGSWSSAWGPGMGGFWWILVTGTVEFGLTHSRNGWEESPGVDGDGDLFPQPACSKIVSPMVRLLRRSHRPAFLTFQRGAVGFASGLSGCG